MFPFAVPSVAASWLIVAGSWPSANSSRCRSGCPSALNCSAVEIFQSFRQFVVHEIKRQ